MSLALTVSIFQRWKVAIGVRNRARCSGETDRASVQEGAAREPPSGIRVHVRRKSELEQIMEDDLMMIPITFAAAATAIGYWVYRALRSASDPIRAYPRRSFAAERRANAVCEDRC